MATVAAHGKTSHGRRKSRRISAACSFLSNISLDGNIVPTKVKPDLGTETQRIHEDPQKSEDADLLERLESGHEDTKFRRHKVVHSLSVSDAHPNLEETNTGNIFKESSTTSMPPVSVHAPMRRSVSMTESTSSDSSTRAIQNSRWQSGILKHRVSCLTSSVFHSKRRVNDKR